MQRETSKSGLQRWEAGSLKPFGGLHMNPALKSGHHFSELRNVSRHDQTGRLKPEGCVWLVISHSLVLEKESPESNSFLKSGTHDSVTRNLECELLKPLLLEKNILIILELIICQTGVGLNYTKKAFILFICRYRYLTDVKDYSDNLRMWSYSFYLPQSGVPPDKLLISLVSQCWVTLIYSLKRPPPHKRASAWPYLAYLISFSGPK